VNLSFSKLASRLGIEFVWLGISRESANSGVPGFQPPAVDDDTKETCEDLDLLFSGRYMRGNLVGRFNRSRWVPLQRGPGKVCVEAYLSFNLLFTVPLDDATVAGDREVRWTPERRTLKGELQVLIDQAILGTLMPKPLAFGGSAEIIVVATVTRRFQTKGEAQVARESTVTCGGKTDDDSGGPPRRSLATVTVFDDIVASCTSQPRRGTKSGDVTWGETLMFGEVELNRPDEDAESRLVLQLEVGRLTMTGRFQVSAMVEKPLIQLVKDAWKDQKVKLVMEEAPKVDEEGVPTVHEVTKDGHDPPPCEWVVPAPCAA